MDKDQVQSKIIEIVGTVLKRDISAESSADNTSNWDSLRHVEVIFAVEEALEVEFPEEKMMVIKSIRLLTDAAMDFLAA